MKILFVYLVIINLLSLFLMAEDKRRARRHLWRIPEKTLFLAVILGGPCLRQPSLAAVWVRF